jgi:NodT family efflux transporter outer membrane factor (OMF) lipoprotein
MTPAILMPRHLISSAVLLSLLVAGCASIPDTGPRPELRGAGSVAADRSLTSQANGAWPAARWWASFGDPQLTALIEEGLRDAPDVALAAARLRRAAGLAQQAGAATLPTLDASGQVTVDKQSYNNGFPREFQPQGWLDSGRLAATLNFDLDLWGKNRAALAAATSERRAAELDARQAELLVAGSVAEAYFDLSRLFALRDLREAEFTVRQSGSKLIADRFAQGLEHRGNVAEAEALAIQAHGALLEVDQAIALRRHQLAELVGAGPDRGLNIERPELEAAGHALPEGVTTELLGRRADVTAARERAAAAADRIKVARADFFPAVNLSALVGLQSLGLSDLIAGDSLFGSVGPAVTLPIFRGGALQGRYRAARAEYDAAVAQYDKLVLGAYREVADAVTAQRIVGQRLAGARKALAAAEEGYAITRRRYEAGLINYIEVLNVEDRMLEARLAVSELTAAARSADLDLLRALGGGVPAGPVREDARNG